MNKHIIFFCLFTVLIVFKHNGQTEGNHSSYFFSPEILIGKTMEANTNFPETNPQTAIFLSIGKYNNSENLEWAKQLGYPKTGISIGYTNLGNLEYIGNAYTLLPFIEFGLFKKKTNKLSLLAGIGASYIDRQYNISTNPFNKAISTKINWAFKSFIYYEAFKNNNIKWRAGIGYIHNSNGHIKLPNQGLNSFLLSISSQFDFKKEEIKTLKSNKNTTSQNYFSTQFGIGQNVLSRAFNDKKEVYSTAISYGKIFNKTFKFGGGLYYRFYEKYYDHIKSNGPLIEDQNPEFKDSPYKYSTNFGAFLTSEILLGHIGVEFGLGVNFYKPFYKVDWQLSQGYTYTTTVNGEPEVAYVLEELNSYYKLKRTISSKLGLKYYFINTNKSPTHNMYLGAHINANLGQADFSELSLGYVYRFNLKTKSK